MPPCPMRRNKIAAAPHILTGGAAKAERLVNKMDCLFCKIAAGEIPSNKLFEDDRILAFYDIDPQAPLHFLVVPKKHIGSAAELTAQDGDLLAHIFATIATLCAEQGVENGYRVVTNVGEDGGQSVAHLHLHVLAKRSLAWPPG